jgi:hypothetical protein
MLDKNVKNTSGVYRAMIKVFRRVWFNLVMNQDRNACKVPGCTKMLLPEVEKHSSSLVAVSRLNKRVHVTRYNDLITKAAALINASMHVASKSA